LDTGVTTTTRDREAIPVVVASLTRLEIGMRDDCLQLP
jgi:hypothetical protein